MNEEKKDNEIIDEMFYKYASQIRRIARNLSSAEMEANINKYIEEAKKANLKAWEYYWFSSIEWYKFNYKQSLELAVEGLKEDSNNYLLHIRYGGNLAKLEQYESAIAEFNTAIEINNKCPYIIYRKALALRRTGEFEQAIRICNEAISIDNEDKYYGYYALALLYMDERQYEKAEDAIRKSIDYESIYFHSKYTLANIYRSQKRYTEAIKQYEIAKQQTKCEYFINIIDSLVSRLRRLLDEAVIKEEKETIEIILANDNEDSYLTEVLENHIKNQNTLMEQYVNKYNSRDRGHLNSNHIKILKGWSSSTPEISQGILYSVKNIDCKGGGIYIRWEGKGIVIDPGIHFVENMHKEDLTILDVDYVIVTHNHLDHNFDLVNLYDLDYQYNSFSKKDEYIEYFLDASSYNSYHSQLNVYSERQKEVVPIRIFEKKHYEKSINDNIDLVYFPTDHKCKESIGLILVLKAKGKTIRLGYTSDTKYSDFIADELAGCDIIIANFSETNADDIKRVLLKDNHLGYYGCYSLLLKTNPMYFVLSEFWGGKGDIRVDITKKLRREIERDKEEFNTCIIPGDIGLSLIFDDMKVLCTGCGREAAAKDITIIKPSEEYGQIKYLCKFCTC